MGNPKAFLTVPRQESGHRPIHERISDFSEVEQVLNEGSRILQASRCMDCGVPFCHWACPLGNKQPECQDAVYKGKWQLAYRTYRRVQPLHRCTRNHSRKRVLYYRKGFCRGLYSAQNLRTQWQIGGSYRRRSCRFKHSRSIKQTRLQGNNFRQNGRCRRTCSLRHTKL